jgi:hypothetical protein
MTFIRGFKPVFMTIGVLYVLMASSMLVRGVDALREYAVPPRDVESPVVADFFIFFYILMAFIGVLLVLFGHVTRERTHQLLVAAAFFAGQIVFTLRDLRTSDTSLGNHLYKGDGTVAFVVIGLTFSTAFGLLVVGGLRGRRTTSA